MSPLEPRPVVTGTMGLPSTEGMDGLGFLRKIPAEFNSAGANRLPLAAPSAARNERRLRPNFKFMRSFLFNIFSRNYLSAGGVGAVGGVTTTALPTISISESPGIHSRAMQARDGALPGEK